jgi:hypothetical protein
MTKYRHHDWARLIRAPVKVRRHGDIVGITGRYAAKTPACQWPLVSAHGRPVNRPAGGQ